MKTIGLLTLASALAAVAGITASGVAQAATFDITTPGTVTFSDGTFDLTDGSYSETGSYAPTSFIDFGTKYDLTNLTVDYAGSEIFAESSGSYFDVKGFGQDVDLVAPSWTGFSATATDFQDGSAPYTYTVGGVTGSYESGGIGTAPETSSVVAFGALLLGGGLLAFGAKRRSSSTLA